MVQLFYTIKILFHQGTIFLWVYWPSFNSYGADEITQRRAMVNTVYALAASCMATYAFSVLSSQDSKLNMVCVDPLPLYVFLLIHLISLNNIEVTKSTEQE